MLTLCTRMAWDPNVTRKVFRFFQSARASSESSRTFTVSNIHKRTALGRVHEGHTRIVFISFRFAAPALQVRA